MQKYRHASHAGNHADVLKHAVLIHCLRHLLKKEKSFHYIDTHAGAGLYDLFAVKNSGHQEFIRGVKAIVDCNDPLPEFLLKYKETILGFNPTPTLEFYPGSPLIAKRMLRSHDQLRLHEILQEDHEILYSHTASDPRILTLKKDGLRGMIKAFPPPSRRGICLIDPSYKTEKDYFVLPFAISDALFKFVAGMILVWYPLLENQLHQPLKANLIQVSTTSWLNVELEIGATRKGLYGSGLWVINPPWDLPNAIQDAEAALLTLLGETGEARLDLQFNIP